MFCQFNFLSFFIISSSFSSSAAPSSYLFVWADCGVIGTVSKLVMWSGERGQKWNAAYLTVDNGVLCVVQRRRASDVVGGGGGGGGTVLLDGRNHADIQVIRRHGDSLK